MGVGVRFANEGAVRRSFAFRARAVAPAWRVGRPWPDPAAAQGRRPARPDRVDLGATASDRTVLLAASPRRAAARPDRPNPAARLVL